MRANGRPLTIRKGKILGLLLAAIFVLGAALQAQPDPGIKISYKKGILSIQNDRFERRFKYDASSRIHFFYPSAWIDRIRGINLMEKGSRDWFELCVNGKLIRSQDGGWDYRGYEKRTLENGGVEFVVRLVGQKQASPVHGRLELRYRFQIFPKSSIMRERLEIVPRRGEIIRLNRYRDQIKLVFPRYNFTVSAPVQLKVEEIRLAEWEAEILPQIDWVLRPNDRLQLSGWRSGRNLAQNHMYHPRRLIRSLSPDSPIQQMKGPIAIMLDNESRSGLILAYEHGSPDNDTSQNYLAVALEAKGERTLITQVRALKGAYVDGEKVTPGNPYATVWVDVGFFEGDTLDQGEATFWKFLYFNQSEHMASRRPTIYYNTWGLQRDEQKEQKKRPQEILTEERVLQEITYAHQLGVDIFVIDDGWQNSAGDWQPHPERFPNGFKRIKAKLDSLGMRLGLWFAAGLVDKNSRLYKEHPEWLVRNKDGSVAIGRWDRAVACFSSGYKDYFIRLMKYWIDQGVTYFKWDGLDKHLCYSPDHYHGDESTSPEERAYRSGYDFILAVTDVARVITEYNPEVIIVYDVTEKMRNVGLAFLSEARFFWMNNGASWYGDLSHYRSKSIRTIANLYNQILPTVLQTSAADPRQSDIFGAQRYNVNTMLLGGGGFWGDLSEMTPEERERIGEVVRLYKRVASTVVSTRPRVTGRIGSSPEIYEFIDPQKAEGQVIAFSGSALLTKYTTQSVNTRNFFCVLRNAYALQEDGSIVLPLLFPQPDATNEAFVLSDPRFEGRIESSTSWLRQAKVTGPKSMEFVNGAPGRQRIFWPEGLGTPRVSSSDPDHVRIQLESTGKDYRIFIEEMMPDIRIEISSEE